MLRLLGQTLLEKPISIKWLVTRFKPGYAVSPKLRWVGVEKLSKLGPQFWTDGTNKWESKSIN
jgi:hypothetical protein